MWPGTFRALPLQLGELIPTGSRITVFDRIYWAFLILGTIVGIVVIGYMLYTAYKYRADRDDAEADFDGPQLGELPPDSGGGRKLLLSFTLSAIIVISLIVWTYGTLIYVEQAPAEETDTLDIEVVGKTFAWEFHYPNGYTADSATGDPFRVPADQMIVLEVTSQDVFHNFGIPELRVKVDAMPGHTTETWFIAEEPAEYTARCFELCGSGHSYMTADVIVMEPDAFETWYANQTEA